MFSHVVLCWYGGKLVLSCESVLEVQSDVHNVVHSIFKEIYKVGFEAINNRLFYAARIV